MFRGVSPGSVMTIGKLVNKLLGRETGVKLRFFECSECDAYFESAKQPKRASCPECLSNDVAVVQTSDSHT